MRLSFIPILALLSCALLAGCRGPAPGEGAVMVETETIDSPVDSGAVSIAPVEPLPAHEFGQPLMLMVIGTTFVSPPWLSWLLGGPRQPGPLSARQPREESDSETLEDLVSGDVE